MSADPTTPVCYVYGIVGSDLVLPADLAGIGDSGGPTLVTCDEVAAVVEEVPAGRAFGTRSDLLAHNRVVDAIAAVAPVLPMRFGAVVLDSDAVALELLEPNHEHFRAGLAEIAGRAQFTLRGEYDRDVVLREVVDEQPEVRALSESLHGAPQDALYHERIRLGELVVQALAAKRESEVAQVLEVLTPHAVAIRSREPAGPDEMVDAAFLVDIDRQGAFEQSAEDIAKRLAGRVRLRLLGPLPAYDFVDGT